MTDQTTLSPDQTLAMKTAARHLKDEFSGVFGVETIENFLTTSYDQFASRANFPNFLPLLAERFARQRLHALAKVEGKATSGVPVVLFLCVHNAGRSQIALGWFNHLAGENRPSAGAAARSRSARSTPRRSRPWARSASTSPRSTRSRGPTRSSRPPTSW